MVNSPNVVNKHQNTFIREMLFQIEIQKNKEEAEAATCWLFSPGSYRD
jgi:hypothetical protein